MTNIMNQKDELQQV